MGKPNNRWSWTRGGCPTVRELTLIVRPDGSAYVELVGFHPDKARRIAKAMNMLADAKKRKAKR